MTARRASQIRTVFALSRKLGIGDDDRHDLQESVVGVRSLASMTDAQRDRVIDHLRARRDGYTGRPDARGDRLADSPVAAKIRALWISGWHLGVVRDRTDAGLAAWVRRQTGLDHAAWLHSPADASRVVEALRAWLARDGGVSWEPYRVTTADGGVRLAERPRDRVIEAQWRILRRLGRTVAPTDEPPGTYIARVCGGPERSLINLSDAEADLLIRTLGGRVRRALAAAPAPEPVS